MTPLDPVLQPYLQISASILLIVIALYLWTVSPEQTSRATVDLEYSPNQITPIEILRLVILVLFKSFLPGFTSALRRGQQVNTFELPLITLKGKLVIDESNVKTFNRAIYDWIDDAGDVDAAPVNPLFLFTQLGPLVIIILAHRKCPIRPVGAVNTRNTFLYMQPSVCCDARELQAASREGSLTYVAQFGAEPGVRQRRGIEFKIVIELYKSGKPLLRLTMWFLQFLRSSFMPLNTQSAEHGPAAADDTESIKYDVRRTTFTMTRDYPRRWAASCKDYNPIHMSSIAASLLGGFPGPIAHGNHVVALVVKQRIQVGKTPAADILWQRNRPLELSVKFLKPVVLPASLSAMWSDTSTPREHFLAVNHSGKRCLRGSITVHARTADEDMDTTDPWAVSPTRSSVETSDVAGPG